jgi:hypothetical protein
VRWGETHRRSPPQCVWHNQVQRGEDDDISAVSFQVDGPDLSVAYPSAVNSEDRRSRDVWLRLGLVIVSRRVIWFVDLGSNAQSEKLVADSKDSNMDRQALIGRPVFNRTSSRAHSFI